MFRGRETSYGVMEVDPDTGKKLKAATARGQPSEELWVDHLAGGKKCLGISPLRTDGTVYFAAVDWDNKNADHVALEAEVKRLHLPLLVCRSKSGGAHLYVFFKEPVPAADVQTKLLAWIELLQLSNPPAKPGAKVRPVEVFPKQTDVAEGADASWINLPYYRVDDTRRPAIVDGREIGMDKFLEHAEASQLTAAKFNAIGAEDPEATLGPFAHGPPCLQAMDKAGGLGEGERNLGLVNVGIYYQLRYPATWEEKLRGYAAKEVDPPLPDPEFEEILQSISNRQYNYPTCLATGLPCVDPTCMGRKYGVKAGGRNAAGGSNIHHVDVGKLKKILSDPPVWLMEIDGAKVIRLTTQELMTHRLFAQACGAQMSKWPPGMKNEEWRIIVAPLMDEAEHISVPPHATLVGQFRSLLYTFLERRETSDSFEDVLLNKSYEVGGIVYFAPKDLQKHLERERFFEFSRGDVFRALKDLGCKDEIREIKGKKQEVWALPASSIDEQTEDFDEDRVTDKADF